MVIEPNAPDWFQRFALSLEQFYVLTSPKAPVRLPVFATTASLPDPTKWTGCMAFHTALGVPVISSGVFWYPITVGAHL